MPDTLAALLAALETFTSRGYDAYTAAVCKRFARDFLRSPEVADVLREPDEMMRRL